MAADEPDTRTQPRGLTARQRRAILVTGLLVGAMLGPALVGAATSALYPTPVTDVTLNAPDGPTATVPGDTAANLSAPFPDANTVAFESAAGSITLSSPGDTNVSVTTINNTWTRLADLDVSTADLTAAPDGKRAASVGGDATRFAWRPPAVGDGQIDFVYEGPNGTTDVVLRGFDANVTVHAVDDDAEARLASNDTTANGWLYLDGMPNSEHRVRLTNATLASDIAPYYANETAGVDSDSWLPSPPNASLDTIGELITRIGPAVLGTGGVDDSGTGYVGVLLTALLMAGAAFLTLAGTRAGPVGGIVAALVTGYTLVELGLAPPWIRTLLLFGVGILVAVSALRIWRS